ncbi:MAG: hypothetical protein ACK4M3_07165 [Pyrobaculum sp.]
MAQSKSSLEVAFCHLSQIGAILLLALLFFMSGDVAYAFFLLVGAFFFTAVSYIAWSLAVSWRIEIAKDVVTFYFGKRGV